MIRELAFVLALAATEGSALDPGGLADSLASVQRPRPSDRELELLSRGIGSMARLSTRGRRVEIESPRLTSIGVGYTQASEPLPNPIPWSEVDTLWTRNSRAGIIGLLGAAAGATSVFAMVGPVDNEGDAANPFLVGLGGLGGFLIGAAVGSTMHGWAIQYPTDLAPRPSRRALIDSP